MGDQSARTAGRGYRAGSHQHTTVQQPLRPSARLCGSKRGGAAYQQRGGQVSLRAMATRDTCAGGARRRWADSRRQSSAAPPFCGVRPFEFFFEIRARASRFSRQKYVSLRCTYIEEIDRKLAYSHTATVYADARHIEDGINDLKMRARTRCPPPTPPRP